MNLNQFCPDCGETTSFIKVTRSETYNIKNEIEITEDDAVYIKCVKSDELFLDPEDEDRNLRIAYENAKKLQVGI